MTGRASIGIWTVVAVLVASLVVSACGRRRRPDFVAVQALSYSQAHRDLREALLLNRDARSGQTYTFTESGFDTHVQSDGAVVRTRYRDTPQPALRSSSGMYAVFANATGPGRHGCCNWYWSAQERAVAARFQNAFTRLAAGWSETPEEAAAFARVVDEYRAAKAKPLFPEEARRFRVTAEAAIAEKRLHDAADRYEDALKLAPWWPEGRFNRALVLGELGRPSEAIAEMRKYLQLVPDAANARQAQDQIYKWEDKRASLQ